MPTDLPPRRSAPHKIARPKIAWLKMPRPRMPRPKIELPKLARLKSSRQGNLAFAIAVILMLAISAALILLHPDRVAAAPAETTIQAR